MAVTSIWPIKGRVDRVINYARNPEKTTEGSYEELASLHAVDNVLEYAANDMKTERRSYVSCLNCREDTAAAQFMETKRLWGKLGGRVCYHGYQSFKADEVTAETAHEIGVKLAQELWGDRFEVVVATHCNTGHYHNHFVLNSVSFADGLKFDNRPADYARMREVSDRLCREYAISVIENPGGRAKNYAEWQAEQNGKPTHRGTIRADIDRAILASTTERDFLRVMGEMGYQLKTRGKGGKPLKYPALKPPDAGGYFRFHKLGEGYSLDEIKERILHNLQKQVPFPEVVHRPPRRYRVRGKPRKKVTGLRVLYFRYCYELHIIVKKPASVSSPQSPLHSLRPGKQSSHRSLAAPLPTRSYDLAGALFRGLAQELARAHMDRGGIACESPDFTAYSVAYMLCRRSGVSVEGFSFDRLPESYAMMDAKALRAEVGVMRDVAGSITADMNRLFQAQEKAQKNRDGGAR